MPLDPEDGPGSRDSLADVLRELRKAAGLSGQRLAVRCSMSQSKVSRIECGEILPTVIDVERILRALDVPAEVATGIIGLARQANIDYRSWRAYARTGLGQKQAEIKALEESASLLRYFLPAIPTGLLQTPAYMRHVLTPTVRGRPARDVERVVAARLDRQSVLTRRDRRFRFLMTEQAVRWRRAPLPVMAEQVEHMARMALLPNIEISIIPLGAEVVASPLNLFTVFDERLTTVELFTGEVVLRDPRDISYHISLFDYFLDSALTGPEAAAFLRSVSAEFTRQHG